VRSDSADASSITDCFARREDAACARAVPALEAACGEKQPTSCVSLGSLYDGGFGVTRDRRKAAAFYKTACDLGDKPGCARFAVLEAQGLGVALNKTRATRTLEALCGEKLPEACIGLAQILQRTGAAADRDRARSLLKSACEAGSPEACDLIRGR
jgi:TPR repeat protein